MKRIITLILIFAFTALCFTGCGSFNPDKEDLSKYIDIDAVHMLTYDEVNADYQAYRNSLAVTSKDTSFVPNWGYTVDFSVKAEVYTQYEDGNYSYAQYNEWTRDVKDYDIFKNAEYSLFDYGMTQSVDRAEDARVGTTDDTERNVFIGEPFSFTIDIKDNPEPFVANKTVKFTVTMTKAVPAIYSDSYIVDYINYMTQILGTKKETAENGDLLTADIKDIKLNGEVAEVKFPDGSVGASFENRIFRLGDGYLWEETEKAIAGHKVNDIIDVTINFPADYADSAELAGKTLTFTVKLTKILNASWAMKQYTDFTTEWEYKNAVRILTHASQCAMDIFIEDVEIKSYPASLLNMYRKYCRDEANSELEVVYRQKLSDGENVTKKDVENELYPKEIYPDGIDTYIQVEAEYNTIVVLVSSALIKKYNIEYTTEQYNSVIQGMIDTYNLETGVTLTKAQVIQMYSEEYINNELYRSLVNEKLISDMVGKPKMPAYDGEK